MNDRLRLCLLIAGSGAAAAGARAVVVYNGDVAANNLSAPADDPGWSYVGSSNGNLGSFVYLGSYGGGYWAISAAHVIDAASTSVSLNGANYAVIGGSVVRLNNGAGADVDLVLFRIATDPGLANLRIASATPTAGASVTYVGYGYARADSRSYWNVTPVYDSATPPNVVGYNWASRPTAAGANASGYAVGSTSVKSWGANTVDATGLAVNVGFGDTAVFSTDFDAENGQGMLFAGDSGGATFIKNNGVWELAGINDAIGTYSGQPGGTAVVGNVSYSTDIAVYRSQILAIVPEPSTYGLVGAGVLGLAALRRRRRAA